MSRKSVADDLERRGAGERGWLSLPRHVVLLGATLLILLPGYFMIVTALKSLPNYAADKFGFPDPLFFGNFVTAMRGGRFLLWFMNSIIMSVGAVVISTTASALAAFAFARMRFPIRNTLLSIVTSLMVVPPVVMLVPLFLLLSRLNMTSTYWGATFVYAGLITPFSVYLLTNFFKTIPHEVLESALIDGASPMDILRKILLPLSGPALVALIVVNATWVWNDLLVALVLLPNDRLRTLMVGVTVFGQRYNSDVPVAMAGMLMASAPMILLYIFGQRYFIRGMVAGAIKG